MKKFIVLIFGALVLFGCEERIEFNNPAFQANKDGVLWKAHSYTADIDDRDLLVRGTKGLERVFLLPNNDNRDTYILGGNSTNEARFIDENGVVYSTKYAPDPSLQLYPADGQIIIESFERVGGANVSVTGTFWFNAFTEDGLQKINFNQGHFYRVSLDGAINPPDILSCDEAVAASANALETYNATDDMSAEFPAVCNAYITALNNQITSCGDDTNIIQDIIDGLDCSEIVTPGPCQTCTGGLAPEGEYCDNGDGTANYTPTGGPTTSFDLGGVSFDFYITTLESTGATCD